MRNLCRCDKLNMMTEERVSSMLFSAMSRVKNADTVEELVRATADLDVKAGVRRKSAEYFSQIAWVLNLLLFSLSNLAICIPLVFYAALTMGVSPDILPEWLREFLLSDFSYDSPVAVVWLYIILGPLLLALTFDIVLAVASKFPTSAGGEQVATDVLRKKLPDQMRYVEDTLHRVSGQIGSSGFEPGSARHVLSVLFAIVSLIAFVLEYGTSGMKDLMILPISALMYFGLCELVLLVQYVALCLCFLGLWGTLRAKRLTREFIKAAKQISLGYLSAEERWKKDEQERAEREAAELEQYWRDHPVTVDWRDSQEGSSSLTSHDHDDLDAVLKSLYDTYGSDWGKDL